MLEDHWPDSGEDHASASVFLRDCWHVLLNRRALIAGVTGAGLLLSALFTLTRTPLYKTSALIQISPGGQINLVDDRTIEEVRSRYDEFFATQQAILQSRTLAERVSDELSLANQPFFRDKDRAANDHVAKMRRTETLLDMLRVAPVANTQLIEISFIAPEPELSAQLANTWAEQFVSYSSQSVSGVARMTSDFIRGEIEKLQKSIKKKEALLQESSQKGDFVIVEERANTVVQQLGEMTTRLTQVQAARAQAWALYRSLQEEDAESLPDVMNNQAIQDLKREKAELERRHTELSSRFKESYPDVQRTRIALDKLEERIRQETEEVASQVIGAARVRYETALREEALLQRDLEQQRQRTRDQDTVAADYRQIKVELDNERAVLEQLLRRQSATGLSAELGERQQMMVRLVDKAVVPTERHSPRHAINLSIGTLLGLVLAVGIAFVLHGQDTSLFTAADIRRLGLPYLGFFPRDPSRDGSNAAPPSLASSERAKFLALLLLRPGTPRRTVLVTSSTEGEGKTFVATQLAVCLAQLGKRVLLVDANLRSPRLDAAFGLHYQVGLSSILTGNDSVQTGCVPSTEVPGLYLMLAGPPTPAPAELLSSSAMNETLKECRDRFDLIVLDSAPLLPVVDSHVLADKCDTIVLVTRSGARRDTVITARKLIESENGKITGIVLNDIDVGVDGVKQGHRHSRSSYGYGYERSTGNGRSVAPRTDVENRH
ncbi:MAG TPA: polysaccharide biosynthesis tyrosine autokinase [Vicinamibacteria bacterium]|nr:polysaccharide biosynthesis tyrosine autokinase [Vicinamibacteria bacterium]